MHRTIALLLASFLAACGKTSNDSWQGYVEGDFVLLASPFAGQLQKLFVQRGDRVDVGKPVFALEQEAERAARLEAEERLKAAQARFENLGVARRPAELDTIRAQVREAQASLELAKSNLEREERLLKAGYTAKTRYDEARSIFERDTARVNEAEAQLRNALMPVGRDAELKGAEREVAAARAAVAQAAWRVQQRSLNAPVSGLVQDTYFAEGEWVPAGRPVASVLPPGNVKARFYVAENVVSTLTTGRAVEIRCDGCPATVAAKISYISAQAEYTPPVLYSKESRAKLVFLVEARPEPTDSATLRPGQPIDVSLK